MKLPPTNPWGRIRVKSTFEVRLGIGLRLGKGYGFENRDMVRGQARVGLRIRVAFGLRLSSRYEKVHGCGEG